MTDYYFQTHQPTTLTVEINKGGVEVTCTDTTETRVVVEGRDADQVRVEQHGDHIEVIAPRRGGFLGFEGELHVEVTVPTGSSVRAKTGSADVTVSGRAGGLAVKSGSGDTSIESADDAIAIETGSGDVRIREALGELRVRSGSGDVHLERGEAGVVISTGSGDVNIGSSRKATVVKTGSGDLRVGESYADVRLATGSGDFVIDHVHRGSLSAKAASGDVRIGIPAGLPVWTDLSTVSGSIRSSVQGAGEPAAGADFIELRATTVSGDIVLSQV